MMLTRDIINRFKRKTRVGAAVIAPVEIAGDVFAKIPGMVVSKYSHHAIVEYEMRIEGYDGRMKTIKRKESFTWSDLVRANVSLS